MAKSFFIVGVLSLAVAFNSYASDSDRIDQLEKEVLEAKQRLSKLESLLANPNSAQSPVISGEGWKSIANWRMLRKSMSMEAVRKILGEPQRIEAGMLTYWHYQNRGVVVFDNEKAGGWNEPRE